MKSFLKIKHLFESRNSARKETELPRAARVDRRSTAFVTRAIRAGLPLGILTLAACTQQYNKTKCGERESDADGGTIVCDKDDDGFLINADVGEEDCNDNNPKVHPGAEEICNHMDDDCNGVKDDGLSVYYSPDSDEDGFGAEDSDEESCDYGYGAPEGYAEASDCDDDDDSINPNALESCDDIDQDCDGELDEGKTDYYLDLDGDGFGTGDPVNECEIVGAYSALQDGDCVDTDPAIYPGAVEIPDDYIDQDCDGEDLQSQSPTPNQASPTPEQDSPTPTNSPTPDQVSPTPPETPTPGAEDFDNDGFVVGADCDDTDASVYPGASEICDDKDNDCDAAVDEDPVDGVLKYLDEDGDAYGTGNTVKVCPDEPRYSLVEGDCDDANAEINPGATEEAYNGIDDDCRDGDLTDFDEDTFDAEEVGGDDCDDMNANTYPGAPEIGDGEDNDCDEEVDEGLSTTDDDLDGYSEATGDCDDADPNKNPGEVEICNLIDDDCDGTIDDGVKTIFYQDSDVDGYGSSVSAEACSQPAGYSSQTGDCNDSNPNINPGKAEICNDIDDDCDTQTDEGLPLITSYPDADKDGYGKTASPTVDCAIPSGNITTSGDCDDTNAAIHPGATEVCDATDNDCDSAIDEGVKKTWYRDSDVDGYGNSTVTSLACSQPTGYVSDKTDCDDNDPAKNPGATEICDGKDNDCDASIDEGVTSIYYTDTDADGYGKTGSSPINLCPANSTGYSANNLDCNDADASINPASTEICDGVDQDCDTWIDDGLATATYYQDLDGDGFGDAGMSMVDCEQPDGYVENDEDCDDTDEAINPDAVEILDGVDNDCDGLTGKQELTSAYYVFPFNSFPLIDYGLYDNDLSSFGDVSLQNGSIELVSGYLQVAEENDSLDFGTQLFIYTTITPDDLSYHTGNQVLVAKWLRGETDFNYFLRLKEDGSVNARKLEFGFHDDGSEYLTSVCNYVFEDMVTVSLAITVQQIEGQMAIQCYIDGQSAETTLTNGTGNEETLPNDVLLTLGAVVHVDGSTQQPFIGAFEGDILISTFYIPTEGEIVNLN